MVKSYLIALKNKGNFSWNDLSKLSGLPEATIRKIFSGETADPRFETVYKLVKAMGGSMDEIAEARRDGEPQEIRTEENAIIAIKEVYEARINELREASSEQVRSLKRDGHILAVVSCILGAVMLGMLLADLLLRNVGWIRY